MKTITISSIYISKKEYCEYAKLVNKLYGFDLEEDNISDENVRIDRIEPDVMILLKDPKIKAYWNQYTDYNGILFILGMLRLVDHSIIDLYNRIDEAEEDKDLKRHTLYQNNIRTELLNLWEFCETQEYNRQDDLEITIKVTNTKRKIRLNNFDNYVLRSLKQFCKRHLSEYKEWDDAKIELSRLRKGGRPQTLDEILANNITWGTYALAQVVLPEEAKISNNLCRFIRGYLKRVGLDLFSHITDEELALKDIRKKIELMVKNGYKPSLYENDCNEQISVFEDLYNDII